MAESSNAVLVGVDWGTTRRRAYALDPSGQCLNSYADDQGALASKGRFSDALNTALQQLHCQPSQIVMSGMVGSALGWHEVPYVDAGVSLCELPQHLLHISDGPAHCSAAIVPGYCVRNAWGRPDVMRGEETQLLGALCLGQHSGWFVLPGTHSKWVQLQAGRILQLRTYMTGELFDLLSRHGTLAAAAGQASSEWDDQAFADGLAASTQAALGNVLFACRARVVCGDMPAGSARSYLSGLLIGSELDDVMHDAATTKTNTFQLIGSPELARLYQAAAAQRSLHIELIDAQSAYIAAMAHIQANWKPA